jgi:cleavage and polyadenylation specificity factor subunit 3
LSRELFDAWCEDRRNGVIIADFAVQGTLAREILASPSHVMTKAGARARTLFLAAIFMRI